MQFSSLGSTWFARIYDSFKCLEYNTISFYGSTLFLVVLKKVEWVGFNLIVVRLSSSESSLILIGLVRLQTHILTPIKYEYTLSNFKFYIYTPKILLINFKYRLINKHISNEV